MIRRGFLGALAVLCAAALAGCGAQHSTINSARTSPAYSPGTFQYVAGNGQLWVVISGNPFRFHDKTTSNRVTLQAMNSAQFGPHVDFVPYRPTSGRSVDYRVELFFYAPRTFGGASLCQGQRRPRPDRPIGAKTVTVLAAFCRGDRRLTEVRGTALAFGPNDERYADMIVQVTRNLFPRQDPSRRNDS